MSKTLNLEGLKNAESNLKKYQREIQEQEEIMSLNHKVLSDIINDRKEKASTSQNIDESFSLLHDSYITAIKEFRESTDETQKKFLGYIKEQNYIIQNFLEKEAKNFADYQLNHVKNEIQTKILEISEQTKELINEQRQIVEENKKRFQQYIENNEKFLSETGIFRYITKGFNLMKLLITFIMINILAISVTSGIQTLSNNSANLFHIFAYTIISSAVFALGTWVFITDWERLCA